MAHAETFVRRVQSRVAPIEQEVLAHPYLDAVTTGQASLEGLRALAGHQFHVLGSVRRSAERLAERFPEGAAGRLFRGMRDNERKALAECIEFAAVLGMTERDLAAYEPHPKGFAYAAYVAWLAEQGSAADVALLTQVNYPVWGQACARVSEGLRECYGLDRQATRFFDRFAAPAPPADDALEILQDELDQGCSTAGLVRVARLIQEYERDFWDALAEADHKARFAPAA